MSRYENICKMISDLDDEGLVDIYYFVEDEILRRDGQYIYSCDVDEDIIIIQNQIQSLKDFDHIKNLHDFIDNLMIDRNLYSADNFEEEEESFCDVVKRWFYSL